MLDDIFLFQMHSMEFNTIAALKELYMYAVQYSDDVSFFIKHFDTHTLKYHSWYLSNFSKCHFQTYKIFYSHQYDSNDIA